MPLAKGAVAEKLTYCTYTIVGVRLSGGDSRIAGLEVTVQHIYVRGIMATCHLQFKPDQSARLASSESFSTSEGVVRGGVGGRRRAGNLKKRAPTLATILCIFNALASVFPVTGLSWFLSSSRHPEGTLLRLGTPPASPTPLLPA